MTKGTLPLSRFLYSTAPVKTTEDKNRYLLIISVISTLRSLLISGFTQSTACESFRDDSFVFGRVAIARGRNSSVCVALILSNR